MSVRLWVDLTKTMTPRKQRLRSRTRLRRRIPACEDAASGQEAMPPPLPAQAVQEFETKPKHNVFRIQIIRKMSRNVRKRPASVKK